MGQKVHPTGIRLGIVKDHNSVWYADRKNYAEQLITDLQVRRFIEREARQRLGQPCRDRASAQTARITIHTARPGIVIGKKG
jgi:small subunit ribosomal protein S3